MASSPTRLRTADYQAIVTGVKRANLSEENTRRVFTTLALELTKANDRFDPLRFLEAAGFEDARARVAHFPSLHLRANQIEARQARRATT